MWQPPAFDDHQFVKKTKAITIDSGIAWSDFDRMHKVTTSAFHQRKNPTPAWTMTDDGLKAVVLRYLEERLYIRDHSGSDEARMARIDGETRRLLPHKEEKLHAIMKRHYIEMQAGASEKRLNSLGIQITNRDSEIVLMRRGLVQVLVALVYHYYRLCWNSTDIANEFNVKPPFVRITMWRMNNIAHAMESGSSRVVNNAFHKLNEVPPARWATGQALQLLFALRLRAGLSMHACASVLGVSHTSVRNQWRRHFGDLHVGKGRPKKAFGPLSSWTPERVKKLFTMRLVAGYSLAKCSRELGVSSTVIFTTWRKFFGDLKVNTVKPLTGGNQGKMRWTTEALDKLVQLRSSGKTLKEISAVFGVSHQSIINASRKAKQKAGTLASPVLSEVEQPQNACA